MLDPTLRHELVQPGTSAASLGPQGASLHQAGKGEERERGCSSFSGDGTERHGSSGPAADAYLLRWGDSQERGPPEAGQLTEVNFSRLIALALRCCSAEPQDRPSMYMVAQTLEEIASGDEGGQDVTTAVVSMSRSVFPDVAEPIVARQTGGDTGLVSLTRPVSTLNSLGSTPALQGEESGSLQQNLSN